LHGSHVSQNADEEEIDDASLYYAIELVYGKIRRHASLPFYLFPPWEGEVLAESRR
jgi:hypothetical protein